MRDNIRSLVGYRDKKTGGESGKPFYETADGFHPIRVDVRESGGVWRSVPYGRMHHIEYWPATTEPAPGEPEAIFLDCPNFSRTEITGRGLKPLYEAFRGESVIWVREAEAGENAKPGEVFVEGIYTVALTDWRLDFRALSENRKVLLDGGEKQLATNPTNGEYEGEPR